MLWMTSSRQTCLAISDFSPESPVVWNFEKSASTFRWSCFSKAIASFDCGEAAETEDVVSDFALFAAVFVAFMASVLSLLRRNCPRGAAARRDSPMKEHRRPFREKADFVRGNGSLGSKARLP